MLNHFYFSICHVETADLLSSLTLLTNDRLNTSSSTASSVILIPSLVHRKMSSRTQRLIGVLTVDTDQLIVQVLLLCSFTRMMVIDGRNMPNLLKFDHNVGQNCNFFNPGIPGLDDGNPGISGLKNPPRSLD
jgi:hypothetical protein